MNEDELKESLKQYKTQLEQVEETLKVTTEGDDLDSLTTLRCDIQQLIDLTFESLDTVAEKKNADEEKVDQDEEKQSEEEEKMDEDEENINGDEEIVNGYEENMNGVEERENGDEERDNEDDDKENQDKERSSPEQEIEDPLKDEYDLFMSEMSENGAIALVAPSHQPMMEIPARPQKVDIEEELTALEGLKCLVPYDHKWGGTTALHHAMVCNVIREELNDNPKFNDIRVRILFTNPTHVEMIPCPFYLGGDCRFSDDRCRFSHGEIVHLSTLTEGPEPNYEELRPGSRVLVKLKPVNEAGPSRSMEKYLLWHRAIISHIDLEGQKCEVKLEKRGSFKNRADNVHTVEFDYILPLEGSTENCSSDSDCSVPEEVAENEKPPPEEKLVDQALLSDAQSVKLGEWEKHTKGIGSKLMISMGYIVGNGLGPEGQGRVDPVLCTPSPAGKSLDHCMEMKELMEKNEDPLKAEKRMKRLQKKKEEREKKAYEKEKEKEKPDVFDIINDVMATKKETVKKEETGDIKSSSCKDLNIELFKIEEEMKRVDKEIEKLNSSLGRTDKGSAMFNGIKEKLDEKTQEREALVSRQKNISREQESRKDKKSMSAF